jgi:hypothetical protein
MAFTFTPAFMSNGVVTSILIWTSVILALLIATNALATRRHVNNDTFSRWEFFAIVAAISTFVAAGIAIGVSSSTRSADLEQFVKTFEETYGVTLESNEGTFVTTPQNASAPPTDKPLAVAFEHAGVLYSTTIVFSRTDEQWTALLPNESSLPLDEALASGALIPVENNPRE